MVLKVRNPHFEHLNRDNTYTAGGGNIALVLTFNFGALIFISWFMG